MKGRASDRIWLLIHGVSPSLWGARVLARHQTLGRAAECEIHVVHSTVSRRHAEIWREDGAMFLRDLQSRNGTFVDGLRINESRIEVGCTIQLGSVPLRVVKSTGERPCDENDETELVHKSSDAWQQVVKKLSPGQMQVVHLLLRGLGEKAVAERLCLSHHTVHTHVKRIYKLLGVQSRSQLLSLHTKFHGE